MVSVGNKVIYHSDFGDITGQVQRVFKRKVQILTANFEKISAPIDDVEIAPLPKKKKRQEQANPAPTLDIASFTAESSAKSSGGFKIGDRCVITKHRKYSGREGTIDSIVDGHLHGSSVPQLWVKVDGADEQVRLEETDINPCLPRPKPRFEVGSHVFVSVAKAVSLILDRRYSDDPEYPFWKYLLDFPHKPQWIFEKWLEPTKQETWDADQTAEEAAAQFKMGDRVIISQGKPSERYGVIVEFATCNGHPNMSLVLGDDDIKRFEPPQLMKKVLNGLLFPLDEFDATIAQMEEEIEECLHSLICAVELEPDLRSPDCNLDLNSLESVKLTSIARTSSQSDFPESTTTEMLSDCTKQSTADLDGTLQAQEESTSLQEAHPVSPSQSRETDSEQPMSETASPQLSERSQLSNHDISVLRMSQDFLAVLTAQEKSKEPISGILCGSYTSAGTMRSGSLSVAAVLERPGLGSDYCWLESPGALSCPGKNRPPGQSRLEGQLKKLGALLAGEVCNPEFLETAFKLPTGWTNPQVITTAGEFLAKMAQCAIVEPPSETPSTPLSQLSLSAESSTSTLLLVETQNPPELAKGRAISFGWTSKQLLAGWKTCTRRTWKDSYAKYFIKAFKEGRTIPALDKDYRYGGKVIGHLRLTCCPYKEKLSDMPEADLPAEGGMCNSVDQFIDRYFKGDENLSVWVVRFEFQSLDLAPSVESPSCPSCEAPLLKLDDGCGTCGWQSDNRHRARQRQNPPELRQPRASGWLEPYIKNKKLKSGIIASYPRAEGERNPDDPHHWYWAYKYEEKSENAISDNGCITRAVSVPAFKVLGVKNAIANRQPVQKVLQFIRGEI